MQSVYEAAGGGEGLLRLAAAWHRRVMADEVVSHAFSGGFHPQHTERLAAYWAEALGGPAVYSGTYGDETSVVRIHSGNGQHGEMDRRAIACFDQAMQDAGLQSSGPLRQVLHDYFAWATTTTMSRYHESADEVPGGMSIPRWSWDGLQRDLPHHQRRGRIITAMEHYVRPEGLPPVSGYSHAVAFTGRMVAISGQVPADRDGHLVGPGDPAAQVRQVFENLAAALAAAGAAMEHVVKLTVYLTDLADLDVFRLVRDEYISAERPPASSLVQVSRLVHPEWRVEIEALAAT